MLAALFTTATCGNDATTTPTETTSPTTVTWTTQLGAHGAASRSFVASRSGTVSVTLQSAPVTLGLAVGVPPASQSGCRPSTSATASPGTSPQLTAAVEQGSYCVMVYDIGEITDQIAFSIEVIYP
jgi:hypothetical protein